MEEEETYKANKTEDTPIEEKPESTESSGDKPEKNTLSEDGDSLSADGEEGYHANSNEEGYDPNNLKESMGRDEFAKTVGNKDYYKKQDETLKNRLEEAKKERANPYSKAKENASQQNNTNGSDKSNKAQQDSSNKGAKENGEKQEDPKNDIQNKNQQKNNQNNNKQNSEEQEKKKLAEKIKDRINVAQAKRDIANNKIASAKAKWYAARHPIEYSKAMGQNFIKNLFKKFPIQFVLICVGILFFALVFLFIMGLAGDKGGYAEPNKFDYNQFTVKADNIELSLDAYTLSAIYLDFFIRHSIYDFSSMSDEQFKNAIRVYALYTKVTVLKNGVFDANEGDYYGTMPNKKNKYPAVCDAFNGCKERGIIFDSWKWYEAYDPEADIDIDDKEYKGLFSYADGSYEDKRAQLAREAVNDVNGMIVSPADQNGVISRIDENFGAPRINEDRYEWIIEQAKTGMDYKTMVVEYAKHFWDDNNDVKIYNVYDYIIDTDVAYQDFGFWWPIGSSEPDANGLYSGEPVSTYISSYYGYRVLKNGLDFHQGIDIGDVGNNETPVIAAHDGVVKEVYCQQLIANENCGVNKTDGRYSWGGCQIKIEHVNWAGITFSTRYLHLSAESYNHYVKEGDTVKRGQIIAKAGSTGCSSGPHLHFETLVNGKQINPLGYVSVLNTRSTK